MDTLKSLPYLKSGLPDFLKDISDMLLDSCIYSFENGLLSPSQKMELWFFTT